MIALPNFFSGAQSSQSGRPDVLHLKNATLSVCVRQTAGGTTLAVFRREKSDLRYGSSPARAGLPRSTRIRSVSPISPVLIRLRRARRSYSSDSNPGLSTRKRAVSGGCPVALSLADMPDSRELMRDGRDGGGGLTGAGSGIGGAGGGESTCSRA